MSSMEHDFYVSQLWTRIFSILCLPLNTIFMSIGLQLWIRVFFLSYLPLITIFLHQLLPMTFSNLFWIRTVSNSYLLLTPTLSLLQFMPFPDFFSVFDSSYRLRSFQLMPSIEQDFLCVQLWARVFSIYLLCPLDSIFFSYLVRISSSSCLPLNTIFDLDRDLLLDYFHPSRHKDLYKIYINTD